MALARLNPALQHLRGKVGDLVFRLVNGRLVVNRAPDFSQYRPTPAQRAQRKRFKQAVAQARAAMADPARAAAYQVRARRQRRNAFRLALAELLKSQPKSAA